MPDALYDHPHWYACYTRARHEKKVDALLAVGGIESFLPLVSRVQQWRDRRKVVQFPAFPGYVFARLTMHGMVRLLSTRGVVAVVSERGYPTPIPATEIEGVRRLAGLGMGEPATVAEQEPFPAESRVRVVAGPFAGVEGFVVERRGRTRVLVAIQAIGCGMEVDIGTDVLIRIA